MSIMSDPPTPPNGGKWELTYWTEDISSYLPQLGDVGAPDMLQIRVLYGYLVLHTNFSNNLSEPSPCPTSV